MYGKESQRSAKSGLPAPILNAVFAFHSEPIALLERNARDAFSSAHIPAHAFPSHGIAPISHIPDTIAALLPRMLGGPMSDDTIELDEATGDFVAQAMEYLGRL